MADWEEDICQKHQASLEKFFDLLGHFSFDKAKEFLEKERDAALKMHKISQFIGMVLTAFCQLAMAEKNYASLMFLGPKGFLRKDSTLKSMLEALRHELQRLEEKCYITPVSTPTISPTLSSRTPSPPSITPSPSPSELSVSASSSHSIGTPCAMGHSMHPNVMAYPGSDVLENLLSHLCGQLLHFVAARLEMMEFYERMSAMSNLRFMNIELLLEIITEIAKTNQKLFHHPLLSPLKSSFSAECEVLIKLLECQINLQNWKFLPSLLCLHEAHSKLGEWVLVPKEARKGTAATSARHSSPPVVYQRLYSLKTALLSKFSLYFHDVLGKQTTPQEMKSLCTKTSVDYFQKIVSFQKRYDAVCVAIVVDTNGLDDYRGQGYVYPNKYYEPPKGLNSFPAIVCWPPDKPAAHWPSVVMIMDNNDKEIKCSDAVVPFYDKRVNSTYFLAKVEPRMTLVIIFDNKKSERDTHITGFMNTLCTQLRCSKMLASIKPGSK